MPLGYRRGLQTNPVNILCASPPVRRAETFSSAPAWAQWTQRAPEQSAHSATCAECADLSAGLQRQGAWPQAVQQNTAFATAFQPFVHRMAATRFPDALQRRFLHGDTHTSHDPPHRPIVPDTSRRA